MKYEKQDDKIWQHSMHTSPNTGPPTRSSTGHQTGQGIRAKSGRDASTSHKTSTSMQILTYFHIQLFLLAFHFVNIYCLPMLKKWTVMATNLKYGKLNTKLDNVITQK
jgi:hypothetical protein